METSLQKIQLRNGRWTYKRTDGTLLDRKGIYHLEPFNDKGIALVRRREKGNWNYLKSNGTLIFGTKGLDYTEPFDEYGLARVRRPAFFNRGGVWNYLRADGGLLLSRWVSQATRFKNGLAVIQCAKKDRYMKIINTRGDHADN